MLDTDFTLDVAGGYSFEEFSQKGQVRRRPCQSGSGLQGEVASLTSEVTELRDRVQRMAEEAMKLKSDLKHTTSARARSESREDEARNSLRAAEGELWEVRDELGLQRKTY